MKKTLDIITSVLLVLVVIFAILIVGVRIFGLTPYTVLSGSMEPEYHVGALIYVKKADASELKVGVPITYTMENGIVVTHRIIEVIDETGVEPIYKTKGDANDTEDGAKVPYSRVIGRPVFDIPYLGYVSYYVKTPYGAIISIASIAILVILSFLPDLLRKVEGKAVGEDNPENLDDAEIKRELESLRKAILESEKVKSDKSKSDSDSNPS